MEQNVKFESYSQKLLHYAEANPSKIACIFQPRGPETATRLTYGQLAQNIRRRVSLLSSKNLKGKRVALVYAAGIDFVVDFIACLHYGAVAIPLNLSRNAPQFERALNVLKDAGVDAICTSEDVLCYVKESIANTTLNAEQLIWVTENADAGEVYSDDGELAPNAIAFIQYTSGSTADPKGVVVSQRNIIENQQAIQEACGHKQGLIAGGWLPQFHDMGLIGHMLQPLYLGGTYVFMPPMSFIQRPRRWLELISTYKIASSAAPNFGYEHCVNSISEREDLSQIDLSCWKIALNGSEPVNALTMTEFSKRFGHLGFDPLAFFPCYGMAEATLFVSGGAPGSGAKVQSLDKTEFNNGNIKRSSGACEVSVVECGKVASSLTVKIVDPRTFKECADSQIGEIWISGSSVAQGYWGDRDRTERVFRARMVGGGEVDFLRTGDMGFLQGDRLFVTGRIKEMIILRGCNIYPYDIERTCNQMTFSAGNSAVFSTSIDGQDCLAAIVEVKKYVFANENLQALRKELQAVISERHQVLVAKILIVKSGFIPKTTSGKIQRIKSRELFNKLYNEHIEWA